MLIWDALLRAAAWAVNPVCLQILLLLSENKMCKIPERIATPRICPFQKVEEAIGDFIQPKIFFDTWRTPLVVHGGVQGAFHVRTGAEFAEIVHVFPPR